MKEDNIIINKTNNAIKNTIINKVNNAIKSTIINKINDTIKSTISSVPNRKSEEESSKDNEDERY